MKVLTILEQHARDTFQRRKNREEHPKGHFDKAGRWYPSTEEARECCRSIRDPSRAYPYSLMVHCRSLTHCRAIHNAPASGIEVD